MYNKGKNRKYHLNSYRNYIFQADHTKILYGFGMINTGMTLIYGIIKNLRQITKNIKEIIDIF